MNKFHNNKKTIENWLLDMWVDEFHIKEDGEHGFVVDVDSDVFLGHKNLHHCPVKFGLIKGDFYCHTNKLTNLDFAPHTVKGSFRCSDNQLVSLKGCPLVVKSYFDCVNNQLTNLDFCPHSVGKSFYCSENPLLGQTQYVTNFEEIKKIHLETLSIKQEKNSLQQIITLSTKELEKRYKI